MNNGLTPSRAQGSILLVLSLVCGACSSQGNSEQDYTAHITNLGVQDAKNTNVEAIVSDPVSNDGYTLLDATDVPIFDANADAQIAATKDTAPEPEESKNSNKNGDIELENSKDAKIELEKPPAPSFLGGARQTPYFLPADYDPEDPDPMPLLVLIHGFTASGTWTADWWQIHSAASDAGILVIVPEGSLDVAGTPFWNATEFCCDFYGSEIDDVAYIKGLIEEASIYFPVDMDRIYLMGHSNGGFMSHRIACDHSELISAIVNMGGSTWYDPKDCGTPDPVSVLQVHGTWDTVILYGGLIPNIGDPGAGPIDPNQCLLQKCNLPYTSCLSQPDCNTMVNCFAGCANDENPQDCNTACWANSSVFPQILWMEALTCGLSAGCYLPDPTQDTFGYASVEDGAARWAQYNGCSESQKDGPPLDLIHEIFGPDTYPRFFVDCPEGTASEVWKILYGSHSPGFNDAWAPTVVEWLLKQSKKAP